MGTGRERDGAGKGPEREGQGWIGGNGYDGRKEKEG
jgi:hypothetical protein